jgi:hypothetical protein
MQQSPNWDKVAVREASNERLLSATAADHYIVLLLLLLRLCGSR